MECDGSNTLTATTTGMDASDAKLMPPPAIPSLSAPNVEKTYCALANFTIEKKIGRGQFSVVYKAVCNVDNRKVALKKVQVRNYKSIADQFSSLSVFYPPINI